MPTTGLAPNQLGEVLAMLPLFVAVVVALLGGSVVWRRFDLQTAVCALPLLTIGGYNAALVTLAAMGFFH